MHIHICFALPLNPSSICLLLHKCPPVLMGGLNDLNCKILSAERNPFQHIWSELPRQSTSCSALFILKPDLVFEFPVESKLVFWLSIGYLVFPEPLNSSLQMTWSALPNIFYTWGEEGKIESEITQVSMKQIKWILSVYTWNVTHKGRFLRILRIGLSGKKQSLDNTHNMFKEHWISINPCWQRNLNG